MKVGKLVVTGIIKNGVVVPEGELPLPEGTRLDIVFPPGYDDIPEEFWQEMAMWDKASDEALELVERMAKEWEEKDAAR
ncbi:MAG: hypothetical protein PVTTEEND_000492 [Candidatus Fervidibacter sp.]|jgi:hypothetical protein|uniref:DNA-binding antitoxin AbrB/MazE fold protein n=1 Tax=Candidatus Fervidibacter sacchari TaxID=1448929 RepID=A0ABT2ENH8_9BACT|nr:hypothetical protein [Candidatus Fervidibacter sacchari]MCS3919239.1 putative DNA-binding antitoxin AbrB/MazE fold protein [Candidatus Fervidibacter sacchari]WKU17031.1 hypothetical protein Q2T83_04235 [Candidatus Fervidibacter sacchari]